MRSVDRLGWSRHRCLGWSRHRRLGWSRHRRLGQNSRHGVAKLKNWPQRSESAVVSMFPKLRPETGEGCGLQVPQASSSESSIAMVGASARADEAPALGGVTGC